jgi:hypothetical protein
MSAWVWGGAMVAASIAGIVAGMRSVCRGRDKFKRQWLEEVRRYEIAAKSQDPYSKFITRHRDYDEGRDRLVNYD